ncbi:hypothetical protein BDY19DRAFT_882324 [Irpex rosettiformis]|uniref:Uncharacterized protein n=1 Tax=Irpex rosettiformis TaxID=378272 RepID=A0ACB8UFL3_9APHY|nr:hypothetical protein BDY19DRAFT_882324 [Irpex rosettiformis]
MLSYRLVIAAACVVIGVIFYIFYWNRIIGHLLSLLIRLVAWNHKESSVWVHIGSIHFSLLGGRISFKDLKYHSSNQTIHIVKGQISWRYWIRVPADEDDLSHARVVGENIGGKSQKTPLACRVHVSFQGLEWLIYNRALAYDNIVSSMDPQAQCEPGGGGVPPEGRASAEAIRKIFTWTSAIPDSNNLGPPVSLISSMYSRTPKFMKGWIVALGQQMPSLDPKDLLPLGIEVRKGAIVVGNESTPTLLCADFKGAEGTYGIVPSRSQHDHYKQVINLAFQETIFRFVDNDHYTTTMLSTGETLHRSVQSSSAHHPLRSSSYLSFNSFAKLWSRFKLWNTVSSTRRHFPFTGATSWGRRNRRHAQDEETPVGVDFSALEYAKEMKIIEAPMLEVLYYADSVGQVPALDDAQTRSFERDSVGDGEKSEDPFDIGNGDLPPEWGVDLAICGGVIRYGPWADRQRAVLQQIFFPPTFTDAMPFIRLKPGDMRVWPTLNILVELKDGVTLQVPFREASKASLPSYDWQWDGEVHIPNRPRKREPAYIHVRAGDNSTISYTMPMVASSRGYEPTLNIHLDTVTVTSSLNDIRLLNAESCVVRCELPSALRWNEQREWLFSVSLRTPQIYLLRDHVNMFTDLGKDWASGPPSDYNRFIPMVYSVAVEMKNYDLKVYVNDHNIIDKPLIPEDNGKFLSVSFLSLYGVLLRQTLTIPLTKYRPESTTVSFDIDAPDIGVSLTLPKWNTRSLFGKPHRSSELGRIGKFHVGMSYCYFSDVHPENIDQLKLMFTATDVAYKACGWTIRYFMSMRQNYFGSFTHFSTLYEYLQKRKSNQPIGDPIDLQYREGSSNALQVELGVLVSSGLMIVPASMRGYELEGGINHGPADIGTCVMMAMPELQLQLRTHNYYMEMTLNIDTVSTTTHTHCPEDVREAWAVQRSAKEVITIDSLDIVAHRLFGPLPRTSTYFCIWEFHVGNIAGRMTALDARTIAASGRQFGLNFTDPMNAPAPEYEIPSDPDVTFLKVTVDQLNLVWQIDNAAAELSLPKGLRIDVNDVGGKFYKSVTSIRVPLAIAKLLVSQSVGASDWHEAMCARMDVNIDIYSAPPGWKEKAQAQMEFLVAQDSHTERVMFLYMPDEALPYDTLATGKMFSWIHEQFLILSLGRGLLDTQFYLPQVRIPKPYDSSSMIEQNKRQSRVVNPEYVPSPLALPHYLANHSESEGEDYVSEADRDARLAKLRPVPHTMIPDEDNDSISTGDESDTDDLTSSGHSVSEADKTKESVPAISQYNRYTRTYLARSLDRPSWWYGAPFRLKRDSTYYHPQSQVRKLAEELVRGGDHDITADSPPLSLSLASPTTVVRVSSINGIFVTMMPLVLPALHILSSNVVNDQLTPEIRFDALFADHLQSIKDETTISKNVTVLDACIAAIQVKTLQLLPSSLSTAHSGSRNRFASSMELFASALRVRSGQSPTSKKHSFQCSFEGLAFGLGTPEHPALVFDVTCGKSSLGLCDTEADARLGDIFVNISCSAPAQVVLTGISVIDLGDTAKESLVAFNKGTQSQLNGQILFAALQREENKDVLDPLSTIQPSYLIQRGRPHRIRTDAGTKYLLFLRHHLQYMGPSKLGELFRLPDEVSQHNFTIDATELFKRQLIKLAGEIELPYISPKSPLAGLLELERDTRPASPGSAGGLVLSQFALKLSSLYATCRSRDSISSEFVLRSVLISIRSRSAASYHPYVTSTAKSATTLSLTRERGRQDVQYFGAIISIGDVALSVYPSLVTFAQTVVHTMKVHRLGPFDINSGPSRSVSQTRTPDSGSSKAIYVDVALVTRSVKFKAGAEKLLLEYKASAIDFTSTMLFRPPVPERRLWEVSMNHSLMMDEICVQAYSVADLSKPNEFAVLAAFIIGGGRVNVLIRRDIESQQVLRATVGLEYIHLNVPRSAIRLYRFMEEWRADYLPGLTGTFQDLLSELHESNSPTTKKPIRPAEHSSPTSLQVDVKIASFRVSLQVMRGTWLSWEMGNILAYAQHSYGFNAKRTLSFGLQVGKQVFVISSKDNASDPLPNVRVKIPLPTFSFTCHHNRGRIEGLALIEMFSASVKPSHWDTLLTVQQKFGKDFSDLVSIIEETRGKTPSIKKEKSSGSSSRYRIMGRMKGFRLGLESGLSILLLECDHIGGSVSNDPTLQWYVEMADLALSLAPRDTIMKPSQLFDRDHRTAFVSINAKVEMGKRDDRPFMKFVVSRTHAVMQPSSIGELGDFVDRLQAEISARKERRAQDMAEFKEKTKNLLHTLDITMHRSSSQPAGLSWLDHYTVDICFANIGIAFPLTLAPSAPVSQDEGAVRAFLFSVKSITFDAQLGKSGKASMKGFAFQFVSSFRQSSDRDFLGETHAARNRLLYPEMTAQLKVEQKGSSRQLHVSADVDGFVLDVESSIPNYISSLIEVYRQGKDRVERFANAPRLVNSSHGKASDGSDALEQDYRELSTSNIFMALTFRSGRIRMFSHSHAHASRTRAISALSREPSDDQFRDLGVEIFKLPVFTVWGEYRATPAANKLRNKSGKMEPSTLVFKSTIHSSQNTLRPTLLPFLGELVKNIEERMRHTSKPDTRSLVASPRVIASHLQQEDSGNPVSSMRISLSLRIDRSKLELTCQPDVNVIAGLNWDSGGFVVNISPGAHRVSFSGSVGGLTAGLKHGFLSEDCMRLHARNLAFTVDFSKNRDSSTSSVSVVCDTEFSGSVRFSRLQDILCFKAVWLDRIPILNAPPSTPGGLGTRTNSHATTVSTPTIRQELTTALIFRLREVRLVIDLGQSITSIQLDLRDAIARTRLIEGLSEVSLSVSEIAATATGNITGQVTVPNFLFQTTRKERHTSSEIGGRLLDLQMTSGPLVIELDSEYQKLLIYRAEPLDIRIYDDWSQFSLTEAPENRKVRLTFTVKGTDVTAIMNVNTVPKLVAYGNKFEATLDAQKEGARRESRAFRLTNAPKPDNPLSEVANAMFSSARSKLMEEPGFNGVIGQRLSLKLRTLRLVVFPRTMSDSELAQFIGSNLHARLDRVVESETLPPARDLQLSFTTISISKITSLNHSLVAKQSIPPSRCQEWLSLLTGNASQATIFSLPSMAMQMHSDETLEEGLRVLPYDFTSKFTNAAGVREEDIYITLNMSLYSWLTLLRKTFTREMDQVQASADVRAIVSLPNSTVLRRSKAPDPLQLDKHGTSVRSLLSPPPPLSPPAKGRASLPHTKSTPSRFSTISPTSPDFIISPVSATSQGSSSATTASPSVKFPTTSSPVEDKPGAQSRPPSPGLPSSKKTAGLSYRPRKRTIERLTLRQLGEATPDVMHPFFMKTAGFSLEDSLPQYVHEYATMPTEEIMKALLKLYSKQLKVESIVQRQP